MLLLHLIKKAFLIPIRTEFTFFIPSHVHRPYQRTQGHHKHSDFINFHQCFYHGQIDRLLFGEKQKGADGEGRAEGIQERMYI